MIISIFFRMFYLTMINVKFLVFRQSLGRNGWQEHKQSTGKGGSNLVCGKSEFRKDINDWINTARTITWCPEQQKWWKKKRGKIIITKSWSEQYTERKWQGTVPDVLCFSYLQIYKKESTWVRVWYPQNK